MNNSFVVSNRMDGVEIAESLLYKDNERLSHHKFFNSVSDMCTFYTTTAEIDNIPILLDEDNYFTQAYSINKCYPIERKENSLTSDNNNVLIERLISQLNQTNPLKILDSVEKEHFEYSFQPISTETNEMKVDWETSNNQYFSNNKPGIALKTNQELKHLLSSNKVFDDININNNSNKEDNIKITKLDPSSHSFSDPLILSSSNTLTNNTFSYSYLSSVNFQSLPNDEKTKNVKQNKSDTEMTDSNEKSQRLTNQIATVQNLISTSSNKTESSAIKFPKGSYIFIPLTIHNPETIEHKSNQSCSNLISLPLFSDVTTPNNINNKFILTCYPMITQLQDLKMSSAKLTPLVLSNQCYNQNMIATSNLIDIQSKFKQNRTQFKIKDEPIDNGIKNKKPDSFQLNACLEHIIESHQLLIKEKNKITSERSLMKEDKFKGMLNISCKNTNHMSKIERELNSLINTLFEINVLISKIEATRDIHFIEPFYHILQNSAELIQSFQYNCREDPTGPTRNQMIKNERDTQNQISKLKLLYIYLQEIRSFIWAASTNYNLNQDSSNTRQSLRKLKEWINIRKTAKINMKSKDNMKFLSNSNIVSDLVGSKYLSSSFRHHLKLDQNGVNFQTPTLTIPVSHYQPVALGHLTTLLSAAPHRVPNPPVVSLHNSQYNIVRTPMSSIPQAFITTTATKFPLTPTYHIHYNQQAPPPLQPPHLHHTQPHHQVTQNIQPPSSVYLSSYSSQPQTSISQPPLQAPVGPSLTHTPSQLFNTNQMLPNLHANMAPRNFVLAPTSIIPPIIYQNNPRTLLNSANINYMFYKKNSPIV